MYKAVEVLITEAFSVITIQQNFIFLQTYVLYEMLLLPHI
jgi:hypothetical protein